MRRIATMNHSWFRFSLRTLFVFMTVFACWLGYELNWVRQRHALLGRRDVLDWSESHKGAEPTRPAPPGQLWLVGEKGVGRLVVGETNEQEYIEAQRLFPEATILRGIVFDCVLLTR